MKFLASTKQFTLRYVPKHVISPIASRYLASPTNPIRFKIQHLYATRDRTTLWWRVSLQHLQQQKRVVRSWCARRVRIAFQRALKERGFDTEGRRIRPSSGEGAAVSDGEGDNLVGSVDILVRPQCVQEDYATVQADMNTLVDSLIQNRNKGDHPKTVRNEGVKVSIKNSQRNNSSSN
ncbi:hypothetical protein F9C07_2108387 [Aspergillus flavus]|uniref:Uncharacterized protein n=4 Tax=Aspergillus subgen. Circumdati TaxID=2720871 RepID=A0A7U2MJR9_ASPFN|nr:hypothetical protein F9C07_2108387 [Aspergillus flavus]GMF79212.1 unnamed protein product [Aspergillus oryzae]GMG44018.1 unnamed protein product [Aspergillus oryzae var. brunneus]UDD58092.1 hypothetical protein AFCA_013312 [Aspergillus flavus]GMF96174.1 unnamed protein product [Aspergillus oryzae]